MPANREQERVYQQVGAFTGSKSGTRDLRGNVGDITLDGGDGAQGVRPGSIETLANYSGSPASGTNGTPRRATKSAKRCEAASLTV